MPVLLPSAALPARAAWSGEGDGSAENPYQIGTAGELARFRDIVNGANGETQNTAACAVLTEDIALTGDWTPIAVDRVIPYTGVFDGQGHSITGLTVNIPDGSEVRAGLFGIIGCDYASDNVTVLAAGTVQNVTVSGSVSAKGGNGVCAGGVVGLCMGGEIRNCAFNGPVTSECTNSFNGSCAGGVVGFFSGPGTVQGCAHSGGDVSANGSGNCSASAGGVVGEVSFWATLQNCLQSGGEVSATGINSPTAGKNEASAGGVVGYNYNGARVLYCLSTGGAVTASGCDENCAGGVVGSYHEDYPDTVTGCYYAFKSTGAPDRTIGNSDDTTTGKLTASQLKNPASFSGWDFTGTWFMGKSRPELRCFLVPVPYLDPTDPDGSEKACTGYLTLNGSVSLLDTVQLDTGWYVVPKDIAAVYLSRIRITGDVNLILCDGAELNAPKGVGVPTGASLTIWGQNEPYAVPDTTEQTFGTGKLTVTGPADENAGIGGTGFEGNGGTVTVNGGVLTIQGGDKAAGIGGGNHGAGTGIIIAGGTVSAAGAKWGAGLGGGNCGAAGKITITDGYVTAQGGEEGAGIGGGDERSGGTVEITGGTVKATGGVSAAGIGGGGPKEKDGAIVSAGSGGDVTISDGYVTAQGGEYGAGIGGGDSGDGGKLTIRGGSVTALGGEFGAGVGGGDNGNGGTVEITDGTVTAAGSTRSNTGQAAPGIGAGRPKNDGTASRSSGVCIITGGDVIAQAGTPSGDGTGAQAIGVNLADQSKNGNSDSDRLVISGMLLVKAGSASPGKDKLLVDRVSACRENPWARIRPCSLHWIENGACIYCGAEGVFVTFHKNDGSSNTMTQSFGKGENESLARNPWSREHFTFDRWTTGADGSGTTYRDGATVNLQGNLDLYAQWMAVKYAVTFVNWDGTPLYTAQVPYGETPAYSGETPARESAAEDTYYVFKNWDPEIGAVTGETTYRAVFETAGRKYLEPDWTWTGYESAEATFTAADDGSFTVKKTATITAETTPAACGVEGETVYTASVTFRNSNYTDTQTETLDALVHDYTTLVTDPTCTDKGYTTHTRSRCGDSYTDTETSALGHSWSKWKVTMKPTCTEAGVETRTCSVCKKTETRDVAALGHDYTAVVTDPTCTDKGYTTHTCSRCGDSFTDSETAALGHSWGKWKTVTPAACTAKGTETRTCSVCKTTETRETDALGHSWGKWKTTVPATEKTDGEQTRTCSRCGVTETRVIPAAAPSVTGTVSADGNSLSWTVANAPENALLIAVRCDGGRMTGVKLQPVSGQASGTLKLKGSGGEYRLILVDGTGFTPLCPAWHS